MAEQIEEPKKRSIVDKIGFILQSGSGLFTALAVAIIGIIGTSYLKDREISETASRERMQANETNVRIYTELMSKREESESALRKDMLVSIIQSFLRPGSTSLEERVLNLELLAYNFHESLNLKPLFEYLDKRIREAGGKEEQEYLDRLHKVASEISRKQMLVLESAGQKFDRIVDIDALEKSPGGVPLDEATLTVDGITRRFSLFAQEMDKRRRELKVRLEVTTPSDSNTVAESSSAEFWIGFFDFPMIDNTRLSHDQRCSVVLNAFEDGSADITIAYFPGSYASLKEKPYYQEVVQNLMRASLASAQNRQTK